jgi:hypothetical protein
MKLSLSLFISTLAVSASTTVAKGYRSRYIQCPRETIIGNSCSSISNKQLVCQTLTSDASSAVEYDGTVWVAHNGLVGEAFTDPPVAATTSQSAKDLSGPVVMLTIPLSNERSLSQVYDVDMEDDR